MSRWRTNIIFLTTVFVFAVMSLLFLGLTCAAFDSHINESAEQVTQHHQVEPIDGSASLQETLKPSQTTGENSWLSATVNWFSLAGDPAERWTFLGLFLACFALTATFAATFDAVIATRSDRVERSESQASVEAQLNTIQDHLGIPRDQSKYSLTQLARVQRQVDCFILKYLILDSMFGDNDY